MGRLKVGHRDQCEDVGWGDGEDGDGDDEA
jgi:hypothetical protein